MDLAEESIPRTSARGLTGELVVRLTELIQDGTIAKGAKLPTESSLMRSFGVSRTVVREAISQLRAAGLVETQQGRGSFVLTAPSHDRFAFDPAELHTIDDAWDVLDFRVGIESEAAALAARRRTELQLQHLRQLQQEFEACDGRPSDAVEADFALHHAIAVAAQNRHYSSLLKSLGPTMIVMPRFRLTTGELGRTDTVHLAASEHDAIVSAIARQEPETARAALRLHLANSRARMEAGIRRRP